MMAMKKDSRLEIRLSASDLASWKKRALLSGVSLTDWIKGRCDEQENAAQVRDGLEASSAGVQKAGESLEDEDTQASLVFGQRLKRGDDSDRSASATDNRSGPKRKGVEKTLCPRCQRIGRPACAECLAFKAPRRAQEASKDEQATETQAGDAVAQRPVPGDLAASRLSKAFEKDKAESVEDIPVAQSEEEAGEGASAPVASNLGRLPVKPTVNAALGRNSGGAFRESPKCQNSRCARLKMALCEPCRVLNKAVNS